jgi:thioredoxin-related protein
VQKNWAYKLVLLSISILLLQAAFAQVKAVQFEQLDSLQAIEEKPVVIFLHTSWCKYCGTMKNTSLKNKEIIQLLQDKFYFVSLDIEEKKPIHFQSHTFHYKPTGVNTGVHELAEQLGTINGSIAYPGLCILNTANEIIYQKEGYISAKELLVILNKVGQRSF